jgi:spermidine/putrescine-binding protein
VLKPKNTHASMILLIVLIFVAVAACGGGGAGTTTTEAPAGTTTTEAMAAGCTPGQVDGDLAFYNWSEYIDPDLVTAFENQYGVSVIQSFYESNEAMLAQIQAGVVYDLIVPSDYMVGIMIDDGELMKLDTAALTNLGNLDPQFTNMPFDPTSEYSVPYQWGTTGLGVDLAVVGEDFPHSWGLIFDPTENNGYQVSMLNDPREAIGAALKYLGYSLNSTSLDELQQAADLIKASKDHIVKFDSDQYTDDLINGEVSVSHGYNGNFFTAFDAADNPDQYEYFMPEEGGTVWVDNMAVPANADHPCTAFAFINFLLDAQNGAQLTNYNYYASPNAAAKQYILPEILDDPAIYPDDQTMQRLEFIEDTGDFEINYTDYFTQAKS